MRAVECVYPKCRNTTKSPTRLCYVHRNARSVYTPGGQLSFRAGGPIDFIPRVEREEKVPVPRDSAGIKGFPYMTKGDVARYRDWYHGVQGAMPSRYDVLDRWPIKLKDVYGRDLDGWEVAIYDSDSDLNLPRSPWGRPLTPLGYHDPEDGGGKVTIIDVEGDDPMVIYADQKYRVVVADLDEVKRAAGLD